MVIVSDINTRVNILLNEAGVPNDSRRWTDPELFLWVTDGQREIGKAIPSALSETTLITLVEGSKQTIPTEWDLLIKVVRNTNGQAVRLATQERKRTAELTLTTGVEQTLPTSWEALVRLGGGTKFPRLIDGNLLNLVSPDWANDHLSAEVIEYFYDPKLDPRLFYVNPPVVSGTKIRATGLLTTDALYADAGNSSEIVEEWFYHPEHDLTTFYVNPGVQSGVQIEAIGRKIVNSVNALIDTLDIKEKYVPSLSMYVAHKAMQKMADYAQHGVSNAFAQEFLASIGTSK